MLRTWLVRLPAIELTLSVSSFQTPPTPSTSAWPPSLPSVPTSRATRVTSLANRRSWSTSVLTIFAVLRNWPCKRRPSISRGIVCERSPPATARMTRPISMFGRDRSSMRSLMASSVLAHAPPASPRGARFIWPSLPTRLLRRCSSRSRRWLDSMISLSAAATREAGPVQFAGMRAEKSPRLTAVSTFSVTLVSTVSVVTARRATTDLLSLVLASTFEWNPETDSGSRPRLAVDATPPARQLRALAHGGQAKVAGQIQALGHDEAGPVIGDDGAYASVNALGPDAYARGVAVLLHIARRLGDGLEHVGFHDPWKCVRKPEVQLGLYAGVLLQRHGAVADRLAEAHVQVD